ncbi:MAG: NAD(P)/FAD-dependent oxidoreductase [Planctomycetota bacterium]|jgi:phytoene dehydrogenase-like protein|nr:NAD(P)/FAD-dependent oxidoreductase [Planctomycetota bacterium]
MKPLSDLASAYDVIVIGAGLGGMTAANRLARFGRKVLLLEQHFMLGGLAAYFKRGEHIFDVSLHGFPFGMVKTCRKYWSADIADRIVQLKNIVFDNPQFALTTTFDTADFTDKLVNYFHVAPATVEKFFAALRAMNFYDDQTQTTREMFQQFFPDRLEVWRFLMEPIAYANGSTLDEPAITYGIVFANFMNKGVYTFRGGTDLFIAMLTAELEKNGVDIAVRAPVKKITLTDGRASGVVVDASGGERTIAARAVLSNASLPRTVMEMLGKENIPAELADLTMATRISPSSVQVYIGIKKGEVLPAIGDLLFTSTYPEFNSAALAALPPTSRTYSVYYPSTRPGHDRYAVVASMNAKFGDWANLNDDEYYELKAAYTADAVKHLQKYVPNIEHIIDHLEVATPRTFRRYTGHLGGASFGTKFEGLKVSEGLPKFIPGMYHTGSCAIIMSGWLGAANYGVIVANQIENYLA